MGTVSELKPRGRTTLERFLSPLEKVRDPENRRTLVYSPRLGLVDEIRRWDWLRRGDHGRRMYRLSQICYFLERCLAQQDPPKKLRRSA